jgi:uncharacterized repeat protein (TIGR01451 family)
VTSFAVGVPASYTLTVTNIGTAATTVAASISDTIPANLTVGAMPGGCVYIAPTVVCTVGTGLGAAASAAFVIPVTPTAAANGASLLNTASVSGGGDPTCPGAASCTSSVTNGVNSPQLTLAKTASVASFIAGTPASYTLQVTNTGTSETTALTQISDNVPVGLGIGTVPPGCTVSGQAVSCSVPAGLAKTASVSFVIPVTPLASASGKSLVNQATVTGGGDPSCPGAARCTSQTPPIPVLGSALTLVKTASTATMVVGVPASYTLQVTNTGGGATLLIEPVTDTVPPGLTITSAPGCTVLAQLVTCNVPSGLAPNAQASFAINVLPTAATNGTSLTNSAQLDAAADPTCPAAAHCTSSVTTGVTAPQLTMGKSVSTTAFIVGVSATYVLKVGNSGTAATSAVATVSDSIDANLAIGTLPGACSALGQVVSCTVPAGLAVGGSASFTIPVTPMPAANNTVVANSAQVSGGGDATCPAAARCTAAVTTPVNAPKLDVTKAASSAAFVVGVPASYTLTVRNSGTAPTAGAITLSDSLDATLTAGAMPSGCTLAAPVVTCTSMAVLAAGGVLSFVIPVTPTAAGSLSNTASLTAAGGDPSCPAAAHCSGTVVTAVGAPQLTMQKLGSTSSFVVGVPASYTLRITNSGTAATTALATIVDNVPADLAIGIPPAGCTVAGQAVTCTVAIGLAPGATASFVLPVTPKASASGQTLQNSATASGGGDTSCPAAASCTSTVSTTVNAPRLEMRKSASTASMVVGVQAFYILQMVNTGTAASTAVATITDNLPGNLTVGAMPSGCSAVNSPSIVCTVPTGLSPGASVSFNIPVTPTAAANGATLTNTAVASGGGDPGCPAAGYCTASVTTGVNAPQLTLSKSSTSASFVVGVNSSYVLQLTNTGTAATTADSVVTDNVPSDLTVVSVPAGCTFSGQTVTCTVLAGLTPGNTTSFTVVVNALPSANGKVMVNQASVSGGGDASCPLAANCNASSNTPVNAPKLDLLKSASSSAWVVNVQGFYSLQVTNSGTAATVSDVTVTDNVPANFSLGTLPAGCVASGQTVTCTVPIGLAPNAVKAFLIPATPTPAANGSTVTNSASLIGGGDPTCPGSAHCASEVTTPVTAPQLSVLKSAGSSALVVGQAGTFTLQLSNIGNAATSADAYLTDNVPPGLTIGVLPSGCTAVGNSVSCVVTAGLSPGVLVSYTIPVTAQASLNGSNVLNQVTVTGGGDPTCPTAARCTSSVNVAVSAPRLDVRKVANTTAFIVGVQSYYTLQVTNNGTAATTVDATVTDTVASSLTLGAMPVGCVNDSGVVSCTVPQPLGTGMSASFNIPVTPLPEADGTSIVNTALVSGGGDPTCPAADHCRSTVIVPVNAAHLSLAKTASAAAFVVGVPASYTLTLNNTGTAATTDVATLIDNVPSDLALGLMPPACTATAQMVSCSVAAGFASGAVANFVIPVTPLASGNGKTLLNQATVSGGGDPNCPSGASCTASVSVPVSAPNLVVAKTASSSNFVLNVPASYTLTLTNTGNATTTAPAYIADVIPSSMTLGALPAGCAATGQVVTCTVPVGLIASASVSFVIPVTPTTTATLVNAARVTGGGDPSCPSAAHCNSTTTIGVSTPQLTLTKAAGAATFSAGVATSYVLTLTNTGSAATTADAIINDNVAADLIIGATPPGCTVTGQTVSCTVPAGLAANTAAVITIPVTPKVASNGKTVGNQATVIGGGDPTCPIEARCTAVAPDRVIAGPTLTLVKTASVTRFTVGVPASYTLTVSNSGTGATPVDGTITDTIPANLAIGAMPANCVVTPAGSQTVVCTVTTGLAGAGGTRAFVIPVTPTALAYAETLTNTATLTDGGDLACPGLLRCVGSVTNDVIGPQLTLSMSLGSADIMNLVPNSYTLSLRNTGLADTFGNVTILDTIPVGLVIGTLPAGCSRIGQAVTCVISAVVASGATVDFVIPITPTAVAPAAFFVNTASVSGGGDLVCPDAGRCNASVQGLSKLSPAEVAAIPPVPVPVNSAAWLALVALLLAYMGRNRLNWVARANRR